MKKIKSIEVKNSSFFKEDFKIDFSEKLNCLMGGRGTGKSTLLYFIKATLDNEAEFDKTAYGILNNNLGEGEIILTIENSEGKEYKIIKSFNEEPQPYSIPGEEYFPIEKIKDELACDIYEAFAIEEIGRNSISRLELIDKMVYNEVKALLSDIESVQIELNQNAQTIKTENARLKRMTEKLKDYETAEEDFNKHREDPPEDIDKKEQEKFELADKNEKIRLDEKRFALILIERVEVLLIEIDEKSQELEAFITSNSKIDNFINKKILEPFRNEAIIPFDKVLKDNKETKKIIASTLKKLKELNNQLEKKHEKQQSEFVKQKQKIEKHKTYYLKYNKLSKNVNEKNVLGKEYKKLLSKRNKFKKDRVKLVENLNNKKKEIYNSRFKQVKGLNKIFEGKIKITLTFSGITEEYEETLRNALRGSNMKYNVLIPKIVQNFTPDRFAQIVYNKDIDSLKNVAGIDEERSNAIFDVLHETEANYNIESIYCPDLPEFLYKIEKQEEKTEKGQDYYRKSEELSTGQRCTTVLPIVFAVSNNPLIIDQPEDNLDNQYISDTIHKIILSQKSHRQLIFITHNPNIPVLPDSEQNIFLNYKDKKAYTEKQGTIREVKDKILNLLEGGQEAFDERKRLYG